jgi:hypothetical protein
MPESPMTTDDGSGTVDVIGVARKPESPLLLFS